MGMRGIRVRMRGVGVGMRGIRVRRRGLGVGMRGTGGRNEGNQNENLRIGVELMN